MIQQPQRQLAQRPHQHSASWVRRVEHVVLRIVSFVFSLVSAHAILWFFSSLDRVDHLQPFVKWGIAGGFGVLGYFVSRGLAHRLLNKEPVRAYVFICGVFELVEVVCNFAMAAVAVKWIDWLGLLPSVLHLALLVLTYLVLSIIPVVTIMLAWVDMDLERAKQGYVVHAFGSAARPAAAPFAAQPKTSGMTTMGGSYSTPAPVPPAMASYGQGYGPVATPAPVPAAMPVQPNAGGGWWQNMRQNVNGWRDRFPVGQNRAAAASQSGAAMPSAPADGPFTGLMNNTSRMS